MRTIRHASPPRRPGLPRGKAQNGGNGVPVLTAQHRSSTASAPLQQLRPGNGSHLALAGPPDTPTVRGASTRPGHRKHLTITNPGGTPIIRD